jgi:hypothetical protein
VALLSSASQFLLVTLRHNVKLEGDVALARRELASLTDAVEVRDSSTDDCLVATALLTGAQWPGIEERLRSTPPVALVAYDVSPEAVRRLARQAGFFQDICVVGTPTYVRAALHGLPSHIPPEQEHGDTVAGRTVAYGALAEMGTALLNFVKSPSEVSESLDVLLRYLLTGWMPPTFNAAVRGAVRAKQTTLALTHDLHIYKAKFFPRMARALLNVYGRRADLVLDPFAGSGTALIEASALGLESQGIDIDPISALISGAKVEPFTRKRSLTVTVLDEAIAQFERSEGRLPLFASGEAPVDVGVLPVELRGKLERRDRKFGTAFTDEIARDTQELLALRPLLEADSSGLLRVLFSDAVTKKVRYRFVGVGNGRYTIEVMRQSIHDRLLEKLRRSRLLCELFAWLESRLSLQFARSQAGLGDARCVDQFIPPKSNLLCLTSPPYLPASSGREHYAESRQLAFDVLGLFSPTDQLGNGHSAQFDLSSVSARSRELLAYLASDADRTDPQRDPMRFARKAVPTSHYLTDIERFLVGLRTVSGNGSRALMVVASQHTFYSHRRKEVEYVADCGALYGELAERAGWEVEEEIRVELAKHATSVARPQSSGDYSESVLVMRPRRPD